MSKRRPLPDPDRRKFLKGATLAGAAAAMRRAISAPVPEAERVRLDKRQAEWQARIGTTASQAALERLEELAPDAGVPDFVVENLRSHYSHQADRYLARFDPLDNGEIESCVPSLHRLKREIVRAQRKVVVKLRNREAISENVLRRVLRDLDLEELRLED